MHASHAALVYTSILTIEPHRLEAAAETVLLPREVILRRQLLRITSLQGDWWPGTGFKASFLLIICCILQESSSVLASDICTAVYCLILQVDWWPGAGFQASLILLQLLACCSVHLCCQHQKACEHFIIVYCVILQGDWRPDAGVMASLLR